GQRQNCRNAIQVINPDIRNNKSKQHLVNIPPVNLRQSSLLCHGIATNRNEGESDRLHYAGIGVNYAF
ncbi:TPA: hypothetical protein ACHT11_005415, partial [Klebsiella pneumoniae]|uniref:hypothetical protein n=4 Tax=Enterobacteriaceae TaxID=543 RepID=UPI0025419AE3